MAGMPGGIQEVEGFQNSLKIDSLAPVDNYNKKQEEKTESVLRIEMNQEETENEMRNESGGIHEAEDVQNRLEIAGHARFAVEDYNRKQNAHLEFVKVIAAKPRVVSGFKYYITLEASDGGKKKVYETTIWMQPLGETIVQHFELVGDAPSHESSSQEEKTEPAPCIEMNQEEIEKEIREKEMAKFIISGGIREVEGFQNSLQIDGLARFAVEDYNRKQNAHLEFVKVIAAKMQVVSGAMYCIKLVAIDGGKKKVYETTIWEQSWLKFKEVQKFELVGDAPSDESSGQVDEDPMRINCLEGRWILPIWTRLMKLIFR